MHKIILADIEAIFTAGVAQVLTSEEDLRIIAHCPDSPCLFHALSNFRSSIVIVASSLRPDMEEVASATRSAGSRLILVEENGVVPSSAVLADLYGLVYRSVSKTVLLETVRLAIRGKRSIKPAEVINRPAPEDAVGAKIRDKLTSKEMKVVALIVQGYRNREIGTRLGTSEQVIKNYLRRIYDKTGVSDRLELALFTIHHRKLAEAVNEVANRIESAAEAAPAAENSASS